MRDRLTSVISPTNSATTPRSRAQPYSSSPASSPKCCRGASRSESDAYGFDLMRWAAIAAMPHEDSRWAALGGCHISVAGSGLRLGTAGVTDAEVSQGAITTGSPTWTRPGSTVVP